MLLSDRWWQCQSEIKKAEFCNVGGVKYVQKISSTGIEIPVPNDFPSIFSNCMHDVTQVVVVVVIVLKKNQMAVIIVKMIKALRLVN